MKQKCCRYASDVLLNIKKGNSTKQYYYGAKTFLALFLLINNHIIGRDVVAFVGVLPALKRASNNFRDAGGVSVTSLSSVTNRPQTIGDGFMDNGIDNPEKKIVEERHLRFAGVGRLYADSSSSSSQRSGDPSSGGGTETTTAANAIVVERMTAAKVIVVGLGGVGSWAAEALCRSGVGNLVLIDLDDICISNTNRQLHALSSTIGNMKLDEMHRRLIDINPCCQIALVHDFVTRDNVDKILDGVSDPTVVLDAIDGTSEKAALLAACASRKIPVVTVGGAAGKTDPTRICVDDLTRVTDDRLLGNCRKILRKHYGFAEGLAFSEYKKTKKNAGKKKPRTWNIEAVYSKERSKQRVCSAPATGSLRTCDGPLGTACFVTGSYGFAAAGRVVEMIATNTLRAPRTK